MRPQTGVAATALTVTELFLAHGEFVARVLRRAGVREPDVADAAQDVFLVVQRRLGEFEGRSEPRTWLYRIAWNVASETRRRAFRRRERLELDCEPAGDAPDREGTIDRERAHRALCEAIDRLDPDKREALIQHELEGEPMREVAARLGIPLKTAFSRVYAARRALQLALRKQGLSCAPWWGLSLRAGWLESFRSPAGSAGAGSPLWAAACVATLAMIAASWPAPDAAAPPGVHGAAQVARGTPAPQLREPALAPERAVESSVAPSTRPVPRLARTPKRPGAKRPATAYALPESPVVATPPTAASPDLVIVYRGDFDLGLGPFGESSLANPPLVAPEQHPRTKLSVGR